MKSLAEFQVLQTRIAQLESENKKLRKQIELLTKHATLAAGIRGEELVAEIVGGRVTSYGSDGDVETRRGHLLEVKMSKLCEWDKRSGSLKWQWAKLFGEGGMKKYDYLVLVGEADNRYRVHYKNPEAALVFFKIPFEKVRDLSAQGQRESYRHIQMGTNPMSARRSATIELFRDYQTTEKELEKEFRV